MTYQSNRLIKVSLGGKKKEAVVEVLASNEELEGCRIGLIFIGKGCIVRYCRLLRWPSRR